mmetsp:Transcript_12766/g.40756  ORF Transcript_12766/g.40756 Transcript_12766/m.40756 type:complete len:261 (-) Transcript_12766:16-798(-)
MKVRPLEQVVLVREHANAIDEDEGQEDGEHRAERHDDGPVRYSHEEEHHYNDDAQDEREQLKNLVDHVVARDVAAGEVVAVAVDRTLLVQRNASLVEPGRPNARVGVDFEAQGDPRSLRGKAADGVRQLQHHRGAVRQGLRGGQLHRSSERELGSRTGWCVVRPVGERCSEGLEHTALRDALAQGEGGPIELRDVRKALGGALDVIVAVPTAGFQARQLAGAAGVVRLAGPDLRFTARVGADGEGVLRALASSLDNAPTD